MHALIADTNWESMPCHQYTSLSLCFVLTIPWCVLWASAISLAWRLSGTRSQSVPRTTQSSFRESSFCSLKNGHRAGARFLSVLGHLEVCSARSFCCTGQETHAALNSAEVIAERVEVSANTSTSSSRLDSELGNGSRDKQSA